MINPLTDLNKLISEALAMVKKTTEEKSRPVLDENCLPKKDKANKDVTEKYDSVVEGSSGALTVAQWKWDQHLASIASLKKAVVCETAKQNKAVVVCQAKMYDAYQKALL